MEEKGRRSVAGHPFKYGIILNFVDEQNLYTPFSIADLVVQNRNEHPTLHRNIRRSFSRFIKAHIVGPPDGVLTSPGKRKGAEAWFPRRIRAHIEPNDLELPPNCFELKDLLESFLGREKEHKSKSEENRQQIKKSTMVENRFFSGFSIRPLSSSTEPQMANEPCAFLRPEESNQKAKELELIEKTLVHNNTDFYLNEESKSCSTEADMVGRLPQSKITLRTLAVACGALLFITCGLVSFFADSFFKTISHESARQKEVYFRQEDPSRFLAQKNHPELRPDPNERVDYGEIFRSRKAIRENSSEIYVPLVVLVPDELEALKFKKPLSSAILQADESLVSVYFLNQKRIDLAPFD